MSGRKKKRQRAPGGGRKAKGYERIELRVPPEAAAAIRAACLPGESLGECVARKFDAAGEIEN